MIKRSEIVEEALTWIGTPWHHHQGVKGVGTDCVQFLFGVGKAIGFIPADTTIKNYEPLARGSFLVRQLDKWLTEIEKPDIYLPGQVLLMNIGGLETHVGIVCNQVNFIHASAQHKAVILSPTFRYEHMVRRVYEVPGVIDG